ncbi:MAG TPA: neutral zinc metallopeptidase [Kribbella sp.]|uniref:neutral zinc metallopeptidase n=1 Tax=Kribbella sp. TaxID=1871183 RepID=UPI002D79D275|nr:neutral zinc metallopeptidase [Kribbella sp.]HET6297346.1 neutral zinc metallopeptidase [Kribbella sp.]
MADEEPAAVPDPAQDAPKPGHFLPGGAGETPENAGTTPPRPLNRQEESGLGKARPVRGEVNPPLRKAAPLPTDPADAGGFGAPPPAPLQGAPFIPLTGTRRPGGTQSVGWNSPSSRSGAQYSAEPPPLKQQRRFSKQMIIGLSVLLVLVLTGGGVASFKLIDSYDNTVDNPLSNPSVKQTEEPMPAPPQPTVTVTVQPVPDAVRVKENKLYVVGKVPTVNCVEPTVKPANQAGVLKYYQAMLPCLNKAWEPLIRKAGYPFRAPKLVLWTKTLPSACSGESDLAFYCGDDETITMRWQNDVKNYKVDKEAARVEMMDTLAHEYGHHVQWLTNILISSDSREGWATTEAAKLEESRRLELQANCLGSAFLGANKNTLGLAGGRKLDFWEWQTKHSGDEYNPKKKRDHGSRKNQWLWSGSAFKTTTPASCNTFTASADKVS